MHALPLVSLNKVRGPPIALEQPLQFVMADPSKHGGIVNLLAVQMENRQYGTISDGIKEFVAMPARS